MAIADGHFFSRITSRNGLLIDIAAAKVLANGVWAHVAATYDYNTGSASLYIDGYLSNSQNVSADFRISTDADKVRIGVIKGAIAEMKVYDVALNEAGIQTLIRQGICK